MSRHTRIFMPIAAVALVLSLSSASFGAIAETFTWTGAGSDGNWSNVDNWQDGLVATGGTTVGIDFTAGGAKEIDLEGATHTIGLVTLLGGGYTFTNGTMIPGGDPNVVCLVNDGDNEIAADINLANSSPLEYVSSSGSTLSFTGTTVEFKTVTLGGAGNYLIGAGTDLNTAGVSSRYLNKSGTGTLQVEGVLQGFKQTNINEGTLLMNGGTGDGLNATLKIVAGATLAGNGSFGWVANPSGTKAANISGTLSPGDSATNDGIGTLTIEANTSFYDGSTFDVQLGNAGMNDLLVVDGNLKLNSGMTLNLSQLAGTTADGAYTIATYTGTLTYEFGTVNGLPDGYAVDYSTDGVISVAMVPEPASLALICVGGVVATIKRRRR